MSDDVIRQYSGRLHKLCEDEGLCPFDRTAVAGMIEYGVRLAGRRNKVTARFADLADLAREACYVAQQDGESPVTAAHLRAARQARVERHNLIETKIREMIAEGTLADRRRGHAMSARSTGSASWKSAATCLASRCASPLRRRSASPA